MSGLLYFISGDQRPVTKELIAKWGLGYAFPGTIEGRPCNHNSMTGSQGYVFGDPARQGNRAAGMYATEQTWRKMPTVEGRPELWVGYYNEAKPTPSDLQREKLLRGPKIKLADGNAWQIPIVRHLDDATQQWQSDLPSLLDLDEQGKLVKGATMPEYRDLWDRTSVLADARFMQDSGEVVAEVTEDQVVSAVVALLQANYVVDLPELIAIGALQESDLAMVALVSCRYERLLDWINTIQKKTSDQSTPSGESSSAGEAA